MSKSDNENNPQVNEEQLYAVPSKGLIMLKATVFALGLVFVVLFVALLLIKNKNSKVENLPANECANVKTISVDEEVQKIAAQDGVIVVLTKEDKNKNQQIIRIGASCGNEINRINLKIKNPK